MTPSWREVLCCSVIGAAHQRRGQDCQDASLGCQLRARGELLQVLVVADGHGSRRSWLSGRGSQLACEQTQRALQAALDRTPLQDQLAWLQLLQQELPLSIWSHWHSAIASDWRQRGEGAQHAFTPLTYGCTLGMVLLAPQWWGCAGLGDWDLAGVDADGQAQLLSEEQEQAGGGEATGSLSQPLNNETWRQRVQLHPLSAAPALQALVLSSDGVRKSCSTDGDYLELCRELIALERADTLTAGLAEITRAGSGDDVSVGLAWRQAKGRQRRWSRTWPWLLLALAGLSAAGVSLQLLRQNDPRSSLIRALCRQPTQIRPNLNQRRAQFELLLRHPQQAERLIAQADHDPLGALIAGSQREPRLGCPALQQELRWQWQQTGKMLKPVSSSPTHERLRAGPAPASPDPGGSGAQSSQ